MDAYSYDILSQWVLEFAGEYMESSAQYTSDGNYLTKVTGSDGQSVSYAYDTTKGNLTSVTEPGNKTTSYTYNAANDLLTKVSQSGSSVAYEYVKRKLTGITSPNGTKYKFTYNNFSQCTATMVGNRTLATNSFDTLGRLKNTVYGNGNKVENVYDNLSRVTSVKYDNVTKVNYTYDNDGNVSKIDDKFSNITSAFRYDSIKRPISKVMSNGYSAEVRYDDKNRVESTVVSIGSEEHKTTYGYDKTGIITNVKSTYGDWLVGQYYDFDALKRVAYKYTEIDGDEVGWQEYIYAPGKTAGSTTSLVSEYSTNGGNSFQYSYDDRGNITQIIRNGVVEATYTYDSFDRLVSETANGVTTTWTYDANGNILTKTSDGTTVNYTYGDSSWKDLLTNYNG
ncbi:MAG: RHS repeat protein [Lachnospira sp.]|nr:RHS repeat protein [Lachnospira sp.]